MEGTTQPKSVGYAWISSQLQARCSGGGTSVLCQGLPIYRHFQASCLRVLSRKHWIARDASYRSAKQIGTGNRENI